MEISQVFSRTDFINLTFASYHELKMSRQTFRLAALNTTNDTPDITENELLHEMDAYNTIERLMKNNLRLVMKRRKNSELVRQQEREWECQQERQRLRLQERHGGVIQKFY